MIVRIAAIIIATVLVGCIDTRTRAERNQEKLATVAVGMNMRGVEQALGVPFNTQVGADGQNLLFQYCVTNNRAMDSHHYYYIWIQDGVVKETKFHASIGRICDKFMLQANWEATIKQGSLVLERNPKTIGMTVPAPITVPVTRKQISTPQTTVPSLMPSKKTKCEQTRSSTLNPSLGIKLECD